MNLRSRNERKIHFVCLQKQIKDNIKPAHWVGHSQLRSLDTYGLFKRTPKCDEKQASVTVNKVKLSVSWGEMIHFYYKKKKKL